MTTSPPPNPPPKTWTDVANGINSIINAGHVLLILIAGLIGYCWHVESALNRHDIQIQQVVTDHAEDRRGIAQLSADVEQVKLQMATRQDIKDLLEEIRRRSIK